MTPTAEWYEADADDADRNVTDDITASTPQEPRGATETGETGTRGYSDAHLLRKRTAALDRVAAENERLRAEVERLRGWLSISEAAVKSLAAEADKRDVEALAEVERLRTIRRDLESNLQQANLWSWEQHDRPEAAEAKLRGVEALADEWERDYPFTRSEVVAVLRAVLARSQAPQAPAEQEGFCPVCGGDERQGCRDGFGGPADHGFTPSVPPATADDEGVRRG